MVHVRNQLRRLPGVASRDHRIDEAQLTLRSGVVGHGHSDDAADSTPRISRASAVPSDSYDHLVFCSPWLGFTQYQSEDSDLRRRTHDKHDNEVVSITLKRSHRSCIRPDPLVFGSVNVSGFTKAEKQIPSLETIVSDPHEHVITS
jgi:hypothetical protein